MKDIKNILINRCSEFINLQKTFPKGSFLIRDSFTEVQNYIENKKRTTPRTPRNIPIEVHDFLNKYFLEKFKWEVRNGVFTFGINLIEETPFDLGYGDSYIFYPANNFKYVFSSQIFDLYEYFEENFSNFETPNEFAESINYQDEDLFNHINKKIENGRSVEIIFETDSYFLINRKYQEALIELIWG